MYVIATQEFRKIGKLSAMTSKREEDPICYRRNGDAACAEIAATSEERSYDHSSNCDADARRDDRRHVRASPAKAFRWFLVHGFTTTGEFWREQGEEFSKAYRVIRINLPGHGTSPALTARG
jgi:pimeloyl-ACP methyl ester carboxylesterase